MDITILIRQMIQFFLLMSLGYFLFKVKIMDSDFNKKLTSFVLRVANPCMMVASVFDISSDRSISKVLNVFIIAIIMYAVLPIVGMGIAKIIRCKPENTGIYVFMTIYSNVGFMGFPIIESLLGPEALFYATIFNMIFNITLFTIGVTAINYPDKNGEKTPIKDILLHPGVSSAFVALILYFANFKVPDVISGPISQLGKMTPPLAMLLMGASLAKVPVKKVFNENRVYLFIVIKQIIIPALAWFLIIKPFVADEIIKIVTLVMLSMPIANSVVMFTIEYNRNEELAAKNVFLSTLASMVLFPLMVYITRI